MAVLHTDGKRKHIRVGFATEIKIVVNTHEKQFSLVGNSKDLSQKGIFISTDQRFPLGSPCRVNLYLTGGIDKIELPIQGTIVRESDEGIGIVFNAMDVDTYSHLKNIVSYNQGDGMA